MTIAAACICNGGIIIGADSEITYGEILKAGEGASKLRLFFDPLTEMVLTGSGDWDYIVMAIGKITERWSALPENSVPAEKAMDTLKQIVEDTVLEIYRGTFR